jgi:hypothetical protein
MTLFCQSANMTSLNLVNRCLYNFIYSTSLLYSISLSPLSKRICRLPNKKFTYLFTYLYKRCLTDSVTVHRGKVY